jgi:1-acyl-sn-glycerol-3-phosphate acyltransferase
VIDGVSLDLPHTHHLPASREWSMRLAKPLVEAGIRAYWRVHVHAPEYVPTSGPVILAANHVAVLDGPLLAAVTRRLSFALIKREMFAGTVGRVLVHFGQIPIDRRTIDLTAISRSIQILRANKVLAVFPEGSRGAGEVRVARGGAVYLAMVTGAPIVPVALLGTREPGQTRDELPRRGAPLHVAYGEPLVVPRSDWPRRRPSVAEWTEQLRTRLAAHVAETQERIGLPLPGPPRPKGTRVPASATTS